MTFSTASAKALDWHRSKWLTMVINIHGVDEAVVEGVVSILRTLIKSLRPSDAYMHWQHRPSLVQIMACRLTGAKPLFEPMLELLIGPSGTYFSEILIGIYTFLNQCWNIVNWTLGNILQWNLNWNLYSFIQEYAFENVWKMVAILSLPQCVKHQSRVLRLFDIGNTST